MFPLVRSRSTALATVLMLMGVAWIPREQLSAASDGVVFSAHATHGMIARVSTAEGASTSLALPSPRAIAIAPGGEAAYVAGDGGLHILRVSDNTVIGLVPLDATPSDLAVSPDGAHVYVVTANGLSIVSTDTATIVGQVAVGPEPRAVAIAPDGRRIHVAFGASHVAVLGADSMQPVATAAVGSRPRDLVLSPDGARLYCADAESGTVTIVDAATQHTIAVVPVGPNPSGLAISEDGGTLFVTHDQADGIVSVVDVVAARVTRTITAGPHPVAIALDRTSRAYVAASGGALEILDLENATSLGAVAGTPNPVAAAVVPAAREGTSLRLQTVATYGGVAEVTAQIVAGTAPVAGRGVTLTVSGAVHGTAITDANGIAHWRWSIAGWAAGVIEVVAAFPGDYSRAPARGAASLIVATPNSAPTASPIMWSAPVAPVHVNARLAASIRFTDPDQGDAHVADITWGDGTRSAGTVSQSAAGGSVAAEHVYTSPGLYAVTATIRDRNGAEAVTSFEYVVVRDPLAGYETGGGSLSSPAGAFTARPTLAGTAYITQLYARHAADGTMNYRSNVFKFSYSAAALSFSSYDMRWLVMSGTRSWLYGYGHATVAGVIQPASFLLSVVDGYPDKVRVKIWTPAGVIYDNQKLANGTSAPDWDAATRSTSSFGTVTFRR